MLRLAIFLAVVLAIALPALSIGEDRAPLLPRHPALGATQIAFVHGGDLWTVSRNGAAA